MPTKENEAECGKNVTTLSDKQRDSYDEERRYVGRGANKRMIFRLEYTALESIGNFSWVAAVGLEIIYVVDPEDD